MSKKDNVKMEDKPKKNWKRQLPLVLLGAALGAMISLNYFQNPAQTVPAMTIGAVLGGLGAYYYA